MFAVCTEPRADAFALTLVKANLSLPPPRRRREWVRIEFNDVQLSACATATTMNWPLDARPVCPRALPHASLISVILVRNRNRTSVCAPTCCISLCIRARLLTRRVLVRVYRLRIPNASLLSQCAGSPVACTATPGDRWPPAPARTCGIGRGSHKCTLQDSLVVERSAAGTRPE